MRRFAKIALLLLLMLLALLEGTQLVSENTTFTSSIAHLLFLNNLHEVSPGKFYRASQMSTDDLIREIERLGIKTVVDLRAGPPDPDSKGRVEPDVISSSGVAYVQIPFIGSKLPTKAHVQELINLYNRANEPILVHCSSGTHRSGVAAAIWLLTHEHSDIDVALKQLSVKYGFFKFERKIKSWLCGTPTIDNLIWQYEEAFRKTGISFSDWIERDYQDPEA